MANKKVFIMDSKDYNRIRRMNVCQLSMWVESVYKSGFEDGREDAASCTFTMEQVRQALLGTKGFGEKRVEAICNALQAAIDDSEAQEGQDS